jgi:hypothetical protein
VRDCECLPNHPGLAGKELLYPAVDSLVGSPVGSPLDPPTAIHGGFWPCRAAGQDYTTVTSVLEYQCDMREGATARDCHLANIHPPRTTSKIVRVLLYSEPRHSFDLSHCAQGRRVRSSSTFNLLLGVCYPRRQAGKHSTARTTWNTPPAPGPA